MLSKTELDTENRMALSKTVCVLVAGNRGHDLVLRLRARVIVEVR